MPGGKQAQGPLPWVDFEVMGKVADLVGQICMCQLNSLWDGRHVKFCLPS